MSRDVDESDVDPQAYQDTLPVIRADVPGVTAWTMEPFNGYAVHLPHKLMEQIEARARVAERLRVWANLTGNAYYKQADGRLVEVIPLADVLLALMPAEQEREMTPQAFPYYFPDAANEEEVLPAGPMTERIDVACLARAVVMTGVYLDEADGRDLPGPKEFAASIALEYDLLRDPTLNIDQRSLIESLIDRDFDE